MNLAMVVAKVTPYWVQQRRFAVWQKTDGHCFYCRKPLIFGRIHLAVDSSLHDLTEQELKARYLVVEHATPIERGGAGAAFDNLLPSCRDCNSRKGQMTLEEYRAWLIARGLVPRFMDAARKPDVSKHDYLFVGTDHSIAAIVEQRL